MIRLLKNEQHRGRSPSIYTTYILRTEESIAKNKNNLTLHYGKWGLVAYFCLIYIEFLLLLIIPDVNALDLRWISCHGRNHSQASCEYLLTIFLCCQNHSEYLLLGSKFSTNLLFAASKCHVTIQQCCSSREMRNFQFVMI